MTTTNSWRVLCLCFGLSISACGAGSEFPEDEPPITSDRTAFQIVPVRAGVITSDAAPPGAHLTYFGGPLLSHPFVVPVYWNSSVQFQSNLNAFYTDVPNSTLFGLLSQYNVGLGSGRPGVVDTSTTRNITDATVQLRLISLMTAGVLPLPTASTYYPVHFPPGMSITAPDGSRSCVTFCAYHGTFVRNGVNVNYGVIPDQGGGCAGGCGMNLSRVNNLDSVSSCELVNAVTDPAVGLATTFGPPLAWYDQVNGEICSLCGDQQGTTTGNGHNYVIHSIFSNFSNTCVPADGFNVTISPPSQTIAAGSGTTYSIGAPVQSGVAQNIALSVSGLPSGVMGSFNPASVNAGGSSTLTLSSRWTAALGTAPFTLVGDDGLTRHTASASVTVTAPPCINGTFSATDVPRTFGANSVITSQIQVNGNGTVASLLLSMNITHVQNDNLIVTLISPSNTEFTIIPGLPASAPGTLILSNSSIAIPSTQQASGTWGLRIQSVSSLDEMGTLNSWSMAIVGHCT